jgi:hypothetical protein
MVVVVDPPRFDLPTKTFAFNAFISQTGIKRFNEAAVYRLTRSNEIQFNLVFESPSVEHLRLKFAAVVDLDDLGVSESLRRPFERRDHLAAVE